MRIAVVEDDPQQARLIESWLGEAGFVSRCFDTADRFLKSVAKESFDVLILDWMLPDLSGIDVLKELRNSLDDVTSVVIVTATTFSRPLPVR